MQTLAIVKHLDVLEGDGLHGVAGGEALPDKDPLVLDSVEPALGWGIVTTMPFAAQRAVPAVRRQHRLARLACVRAPSIGRVDQPRDRLASKPTPG